MSRALAGALVAAGALVLVVALVLLRSQRQARSGATERAEDPAPAPAAPPPEPPPQVETRTASLWLPAPGGRIASTPVEVSSAPDPQARIDALVAALLAATPAPPLAPLFDGEVKLVATLRGPDATLYVDLTAGEGVEPPASGSQLELQRVYSIVQTVVANEPSVERVVLLWNGVQRPSLSGHVDTGHALVPRRELVADTERAEPRAEPNPPAPAADEPAPAADPGSPPPAPR